MSEKKKTEPKLTPEQEKGRAILRRITEEAAMLRRMDKALPPPPDWSKAEFPDRAPEADAW